MRINAWVMCGRCLFTVAQAARVLPTSGNPYNQMAVVAYYGSEEMRAVSAACETQCTPHL